MIHIDRILSFANHTFYAGNPTKETPKKGNSTSSSSEPKQAQAEQFMARCKVEERSSLEKRIQTFRNGIEAQQAAGEEGRVKALEKALSKTQEELSHLTATCEEASKKIAENPKSKPLPPPEKPQAAKKGGAEEAKGKDGNKPAKKKSRKKTGEQNIENRVIKKEVVIKRTATYERLIRINPERIELLETLRRDAATYKKIESILRKRLPNQVKRMPLSGESIRQMERLRIPVSDND